MENQDEFYLAKEGNAFYERWSENPNRNKGEMLRDSRLRTY